MSDYQFDRHLRYDELVTWMHHTAAAFPHLMTVERYGSSHEGRDLLLATLTNSATGPAADKPAHWVDANIHSVEVTAGVAALALIDSLVNGFGTDQSITTALDTRTFYVVPRVNPDGVEWALSATPTFRRSSVRRWPWGDGTRRQGAHIADVDGDGRALSMRVADPNGGWTTCVDDPRLMVPVPIDGMTNGRPRYRLYYEGDVADYDGFTVPTPRSIEGLDLNRNFPAGWSTSVVGSGDHPLSEPEIDSLVRAIVARPNICGYNAYHTSGGVLLRPSGVKPDTELSPYDVWTWSQLGEIGTSLTGYNVHSSFDDFTWDKSHPMSGAADDWAYDHLGVFCWTTEFWDIVHAATGQRARTDIWYVGPTIEQELAVLRWVDEHHPGAYVDWYAFDHPQLGAIELGGWDTLHTWINPPPSRLRDEVKGHAAFAVSEALAAPCVAIVHTEVTRLGDDTWRVAVGVANTGWLPTTVTDHAAKADLVLPGYVELTGATTISGPARQFFGQLAGSSAARFRDRHDGTPDRALVAWTIRGHAGSTVTATAAHQRAGTVSVSIELS